MEGWRELLIVCAAALAVACARERINDEPGPPAVIGAAEPSDAPSAAGGGAPPPDADSLLPPLPEYTTDDDAEPGEVRASLDHGSIPYVDVRRRLVLDERGFTSGEVTVVTLQPEPGAAERLLAHQHGDAARSRIRLAGEEMIRLETEPHAAIAWVGPGFVVTFRRGQERGDEWLEDLVRATVRAVAVGEGEPRDRQPDARPFTPSDFLDHVNSPRLS